MVLLVLRSLFVYSVRLGSRSVYLFIFSFCIFVFYFHSISCMSKSYRSECIMSILRFIFLFVSRILRNYVPISSKKVPFLKFYFCFFIGFNSECIIVVVARIGRFLSFYRLSEQRVLICNRSVLLEHVNTLWFNEFQLFTELSEKTVFILNAMRIAAVKMVWIMRKPSRS